MKLNEKLLKSLVDEVVYPVESLLTKEMNLSSEDSVKLLKEVGFLKVALIPFYENFNIEIVKENIKGFEKLYHLPVDSAYIKELLGCFCDLLKAWMKKNGLCHCEEYNKLKEFIDCFKSTNGQACDCLEENSDFFDFSDEIDENINSMHYAEHEKVSAAEYMSGKYVDFDLLLDIKEMLEHYDGISYKFDSFSEEYAEEINVILRKFIALFELSGEFRDLAKAIDHLVEIINSFEDINEIESSKKEILKMFIDAIIDDLMKWYQEVVEERTANDIHYLDASLLSSIKQIEIMFSQDSSVNGE